MHQMFNGLTSTFKHQSNLVSAIPISLDEYSTTLKRAKERYLDCLASKLLKHHPQYILQSADEYTLFLIYLASEAWQDDCIELANAVYLVNRRLNSIDCFYTRKVPDKMHLVHPLGTVLGDAIYNDFFVAYQGVTVGSDIQGRYPIFEGPAVLFSKSSVLGTCTIGFNSAIGAGTQLYGQKIPANHSLSLRNPSNLVQSKITWSVKELFFKA